MNDGRGVPCWSFADCVFDEGNWTLSVAGRRVSIEHKPLKVLRHLLVNAGNLVSKDELLDTVWPDTAVVEASLPTAVRKLRAALDDDQRQPSIIETVPRLGYRLSAAVEVVISDRRPRAMIVAPGPQPDAFDDRLPAHTPAVRSVGGLGRVGLAALGAALVIGSIMLVSWLSPSPQMAAEQSTTRGTIKTDPDYSRRWAVATALRKTDLAALERHLAAGWDPNQPFDKDGNGALNILLNNCEWDPAHDRRAMLLMARTLLDGGADLTRRNIWGDTAYSIAKADRYCGPDHPVTQMLEAMCYGGSLAPKDQCLATYELSDVQRKAQGLPSKS